MATCDWHSDHTQDGLPCGKRCGAPATHRIVWLDGSKRYSFGCDAHLKLDQDATRFLTVAIDARANGGG